ncbi:MAG: AAA family ATPase [Nitrospira sp.]
MPTILTPADLLKLETESWIDQSTAEQFGLRRVDTFEGAELVGQRAKEDHAGIVFHGFWPGDDAPRVRTLRRDNPSLEKNSEGILKPIRKYLNEPGRGNRISFGPNESPNVLKDVRVTFWMTEGPKQLCALWRLARDGSEDPQAVVCAINGVHGYRGTIGKVVNSNGKRVDENGVISDFDRITWVGRDVVIMFDSDCKTNRKVAAARRRLVAELKKRRARVTVVDLPVLDGMDKTGVDDFLAQCGPEEALELIQQAIASPTSEPPPTGKFAPMSLAQLLDEPEPLEPEWTLEDILATESLAAIVSKPKVGKSTLIYELAVAVTQGRMFLGRVTKRGNVLILAVEENRRDVKRRLRNLGVEQLDAMHVHIAMLSDSPDNLHALVGFIKQHSIVLVIFDTLNTFWSVADENNAGEVTEAVKPLLALARNSGATVLLIHHSRKAEGDHGDEIRGSGALFSLLDTALILKRHSVETQRRLSIIGRYAESPPELLLELKEQGYVSLGDPVASVKAAKLTKLANALTDAPMGVKDLAAKAELPTKSTYTLLDLLTQQSKAVRSGTGKKKDPFLYSKCVSVSVLMTGGQEATNCPQPVPSANGLPLGEGFVSSYPLISGVETETNSTDTISSGGTDSFLPTPVPPGSNEPEPEEVVDL